MKFSIIIPAYNEAQSIARSLAALRAQTVSKEQFEILVIDNNSTDGMAEVARAAGADKVVLETKKGTNFARQRGVVESSGEIVAFLDADSEPLPTWLETIQKDLTDAKIAAVSGPFDYGFTGFKKRLDAVFSHKLLPNLSKILYALFHKKAGVIIGGNFAVKREALNAIGGLPPLSFWGDDAATAMLLSRKVGYVLFDPHLVVKSSPRRFEKEGLMKLETKYAGAYLKAYFSKNYR